MKRGFNKNQLASVGAAVIACTALENVLVEIYAVQKFKVAAQDNDEPTYRFLYSAMRKNHGDLSKFISRQAERENLTEREKYFFETYLTKMKDADGREFYPFSRWRDTLCHGMYRPLPDGKLQIIFRDYDAFQKDNATGEIKFNAAIDANHTPQVLETLTQNLEELSSGLIRVFSLSSSD
jgi:hypothetical protein